MMRWCRKGGYRWYVGCGVEPNGVRCSCLSAALEAGLETRWAVFPHTQNLNLCGQDTFCFIGQIYHCLSPYVIFLFINLHISEQLKS